MKALIAARDDRPGGFTWTDEGELVGFGHECCNKRECGCDRSFIGLKTRKATTLARVVEVVTHEELDEEYRASMELAGWAAFMQEEDILAEIKLIELAAEPWPVGTTIAIRDGFIHEVRPPLN